MVDKSLRIALKQGQFYARNFDFRIWLRRSIASSSYRFPFDSQLYNAGFLSYKELHHGKVREVLFCEPRLWGQASTHRTAYQQNIRFELCFLFFYVSIVAIFICLNSRRLEISNSHVRRNCIWRHENSPNDKSSNDY